MPWNSQVFHGSPKTSELSEAVALLSVGESSYREINLAPYVRAGSARLRDPFIDKRWPARLRG